MIKLRVLLVFDKKNCQPIQMILLAAFPVMIVSLMLATVSLDGPCHGPKVFNPFPWMDAVLILKMTCTLAQNAFASCSPWDERRMDPEARRVREGGSVSCTHLL